MKILGQFFADPLFKHLKKHSCKSENSQGNFFADTIFKYLKKYTCQSYHKLAQFVADSRSQIYNESVFANLSIPTTTFYLYTFYIFKKVPLQI